jgi:hypothetical protein
MKNIWTLSWISFRKRYHTWEWQERRGVCSLALGGSGAYPVATESAAVNGTDIIAGSGERGGEYVVRL